jgi:hypothetical protein
VNCGNAGALTRIAYGAVIHANAYSLRYLPDLRNGQQSIRFSFYYRVTLTGSGLNSRAIEHDNAAPAVLDQTGFL